jgi:hypothetical protein
MKKNPFSFAGIPAKFFTLFSLLLMVYYSSTAQFSPLPETTRPGDGKGWLDNGTVKIAVNLNYGGAITYFSPSGSSTNMVNNSDHGRQAQFSVYSGPDNFAQSSPVPQWQVLGWNPIEAGDLQGNAPTVITYHNDGTTIYTKVRPYFWPLVAQQAECYIEKWISLDGHGARLHFRFTNFRSDQTLYYARHQEIPCLYSVIDYNQTFFYSGDQPFTNAGTTTVTSSSSSVFEHCSENWMAFKNSSGESVGLWGKEQYDFVRAKFGSGSSGGEFGGDANYMAISPNLALYPGASKDWDCALIGGSTSDIRSWVYSQPRPPTLPDFQFTSSRNDFTTYAVDEAGAPSGEWDLSVTNQSDWNIASPAVFYKSSDFSKVYITAAFSLNNVTNMAVGWYRYGQGAGNVLDLNQVSTFPIVNDGQFHTYEVTLNSNANWTSGIKQLLVFRDPATTGNTTGTFKLKSISYQNTTCTPPSAPTIAVTSQDTSTCSNGSKTVSITASGCSGSLTWSNGGTGSSINVTAPGTYTASCTVGGCTSSASNAKTIINGSCSGGSNPCGFTEKGVIGTWSGLSVQTRQFTVSGSVVWLICTVPSGTSDDKHFPRGANFATRTDVSWTSGAPAKSCFGGGDTGWDGLVIPTGITVPSGYSQGTETDGAVYFAQSGGGCSTPSAPSLSASPTSITSGSSSTLSASGCSGGTITWSNSLGTGTSKTASPTTTTTYTATCTIGACTSSNGSVTVTVTPPSGGSFSQCLESESSSGDGSITTDPNASNGSTRGLESSNNHYVDYAVTSVPTAGTYTVTLRYYSSSAPTIGVQVNGGTSQTVNLANSGSWNIVWTTQTFNVTLASGSNTIHIYGISGGSCRQDKICVNNPGSPLMLDMNDPGQISQKSPLLVSPNPSNGAFDASFFVEKGKKATLVVSDMQGRTLYRKTFTGSGQINSEKLNLIGKASGTLIVQLHKESTIEVKKINIVR